MVFFFPFIFISWRLITLQYCSGFCHTLTWISHGFTRVPHPDPPSRLPLHPIPLGLPSAPALSTRLMHPPWAGDLFTLDRKGLPFQVWVSLWLQKILVRYTKLKLEFYLPPPPPQVKLHPEGGGLVGHFKQGKYRSSFGMLRIIPAVKWKGIRQGARLHRGG